MTRQKSAKPRSYKDRVPMFAFLKLFGIVRLRVHYDGGGKDYTITIEQCEGLIEKPRDLPIDGWLHRAPDNIAVRNAIAHAYNMQEPTLEGVIFAFTEEILDASEFEWRYGEGGWGYINIVPAENFIHLDANVREITSTNHESKM